MLKEKIFIKVADAKCLIIRVSVSCLFLTIEKLDDEIRRVKNLKSKLPPWYVDSSPSNLMWDEIPVKKISGVRKK